jgi:flagellar biosynthesis chaperone FliJ
MVKPSLTQANNITADLVLELGKLYSSNELRSVQTKLTGTAREIRKLTGERTLLGRLGDSLTREQRQLLQDAARLIDSVNTNITHAKERKKRAEDTKAAWRKQREKDAKTLCDHAFPLPYETLEQKLEVIKLALVLHQLRIYQDFRTAALFHHSLREDVTDFSKLIGWKIPAWKLSRLTSYRLDIQQSIQHAITRELDDLSVQAQLDNLQKRIADIQEQVLAAPLAVETLRIWSDAFSPEADQNPSSENGGHD